MISELRITDPDNTCIPWWPKVKWLQGRESIKFEPGLNILWGPNGSGKSTVMRAISRMLHAEQGGKTIVTSHSVRTLFEHRRDEGDGYKNGAMPIHDGQAIMHFDPMHAVGLAAGGAAFDWDFGMEGVGNTMFRGSSGQTTLQRFNAVLEVVLTRKWPETQWHHNSGGPTKAEHKPDDRWKVKPWLVGQTLEGTLKEKGPRTILLDEPDRSLDLPYQWGLWNRLAKEQGIQMIIASHSLVALGIKGANYIELGDGDYLSRSERVLDLVVERALLQMEGLDRDTKLNVLKTMFTKSSQQKAQVRRDPRHDPQEGDLVRVKHKGGYQLRVVVNRKRPNPQLDTVRWRDEGKGKGGNIITIKGWRKLCKKDATVLRVGLPQKESE